MYLLGFHIEENWRGTSPAPTTATLDAKSANVARGIGKLGEGASSEAECRKRSCGDRETHCGWN